GILAALVVVGRWSYYEAIKRAWIRYNEYDLRSEGTLRVGDLAPDLEMRSVRSEAPVKLSDLYQDTPLVLVFGSYT
ncbi:MAG: deiodinase-related protein, partial [Acidobacteriota bacterium]